MGPGTWQRCCVVSPSQCERFKSRVFPGLPPPCLCLSFIPGAALLRHPPLPAASIPLAESAAARCALCAASVAGSNVGSSKPAAPKVAVPRVGRGTRATDELQDDRGKTYFHYQLRWGGRRSKAEIIAEMEADWAVPSSMPRPSKAPMDDAEKDRLVTMMRWRGKPPEVTPEEVAAQLRTRKGAAAPARTRAQELEELFEQTLKEIDDRRQFLQDMRSQGKAAEYEAQIQTEIQQRIADLKQLDDMIERERQEAAAA
mmetsp:Transcript_37132/g.93839  ORF Transcript_37132/g.93839 Transcript_37132/m.93839 type:complete len:257 (+) Transcript_37132:245-1015(+)